MDNWGYISVGCDMEVSLKFPNTWNRSGYARFKSSVELIVTPLVTAQFNVTRFKSRDVGRPMITGPGVLTMYTSLSLSRLHTNTELQSCRGVSWPHHCRPSVSLAGGANVVMTEIRYRPTVRGTCA